MNNPQTQTFAEILRASALPPDAAVVLELAASGRHLETGKEVQRVQRGEVPPLRPEFDQINAVLMVLYLRHAVRQLGAENETGRAVTKLADDLATMVGEFCPWLRKVLSDGRERDKQVQPVDLSELEDLRRDRARVDWLQNAFLGGDARAGEMIGLPGFWTTLRTEVDRAIEEGR